MQEPNRWCRIQNLSASTADFKYNIEITLQCITELDKQQEIIISYENKIKLEKKLTVTNPATCEVEVMDVQSEVVEFNSKNAK